MIFLPDFTPPCLSTNLSFAHLKTPSVPPPRVNPMEPQRAAWNAARRRGTAAGAAAAAAAGLHRSGRRRKTSWLTSRRVTAAPWKDTSLAVARRATTDRGIMMVVYAPKLTVEWATQIPLLRLGLCPAKEAKKC